MRLGDNTALRLPRTRPSSLIRRVAWPGVLARGARAAAGVDAPRVLFAATGGSSGLPGMGRELYRTEPAFRDSIDACSHILQDRLGCSVADRLRSPSDDAMWSGANGMVPRFGGSSDREIAPQLQQLRRRDEFVLLGMLQLALCDLWRSVGVTPDATIGISLGEVAAAYAAGALSREDAALVVAAIATGVADTLLGVLFTVDVDSRTARSLCVRAPGRLELLGAVDLTTCLLLASERDAPTVREFLVRESVVHGEFETDRAYHTPRAIADPRAMAEALSAITPHAPSCPIYSAAAGGLLEDARLDAAHWHWMTSRSFYYDEAVAAALTDGYDLVISIGVHPAQKAALESVAAHLGRPVRCIDSLRQDEPELTTWRRATHDAGDRRIVGPSGTPTTERSASSAENLDLNDRRTTQSPFVRYADLRREGAVHYLPRHDYWLVLGYEEVRTVFSHPRVYSSRLMATVDPVLLGADGAAHASVRRAIAPSLSAETAHRLAGEMDHLAHQLLAPLLAGRDFDVVTEFAAPLAEFVAARVLEVDEASAASLIAAVGDSEVETVTLFERFGSSMAPLVDRSGLAGVLRKRCALDDDQIHAALRTLWIAATSTTKRVVTSSIRLLAEQPALRAQLTAEPALLDAFVAESIRLHPPELLIGRVTTAPVTLGGKQIPEGSVVQLCIGAANRDPVRFPDPDQVRLDRNQEDLAFGWGAHGCPGAGLAGVQTRIALGALLQLAPFFGLAQPVCMMRYLPSSTTHGLEQLVVNRGTVST